MHMTSNPSKVTVLEEMKGQEKKCYNSRHFLEDFHQLETIKLQDTRKESRTMKIINLVILFYNRNEKSCTLVFVQELSFSKPNVGKQSSLEI